jgi:hypothetical protein
MLGSIPRSTIDVHSIEEAITRFLETNPPQLYRGGA